MPGLLLNLSLGFGQKFCGSVYACVQTDLSRGLLALCAEAPLLSHVGSEGVEENKSDFLRFRSINI